MSHHVVITTADGRTHESPRFTTGPCFTDMLRVSSVTLGKAIPLKDGSTLRTFRFVGPQTKDVDLANYQDLFLSNRQWFGRIWPA